YSGAGVRVMVLDTGFLKSHPAFALTNWIAEWDFVNEDGNTANEAGDIATQHNHGTGVWGVAGGYAPGALIGPAFAAEWVLAKTENVPTETHAEEDNYVAALEWADTLGVDVTTASLAYFGFDDGTGYTKSQLDGDTAVITRAVDLAVAKGIACVNAMGNSGPMATSLETPADADSVIAVGAVDSCAVIPNFSSRGPTWDGRTKPEIVARGVSTYWARASGGFAGASGTSLATPLIGGLAALLKEAHPSWSGFQIRAALMATGTQSGAPDNNYGWGLAQASSALSYSSAPQPPRMTLPFKLLTPASGASLTDVTPTLLWRKSKAVIPGDQAMYRLLLDDNAAFASPETILVGPDTTYTFAIGLPPGAQRWWKVEALGNLGYVRRSMNTHVFTISNTVAVTPEPGTSRLMLGAAAPNPMRGTTAFQVQVPEGERARVEIISVSGRVIRRFDLIGNGAVHSLRWDGTDAAGHRVPAGMYVYRLSGARTISAPARKILVLAR
ncbi:MAG TPA: S8 family serine peptidase, partial [Candidatus Eisenbacteria bacterium]|nr:S8 family serine peptidase [Candidatus Eisenbacteria bacterium]